MFVFQWVSKDSQVVSIVWTGEEVPYLFLATSENVGLPMVLLGFLVTVGGYLFLPAESIGFPLILHGLPALSFLTCLQ